MTNHKLDALRKAIMDEGSHPLHHRQVMARHRREWPVLWKAIDDLVLGHGSSGIYPGEELRSTSKP